MQSGKSSLKSWPDVKLIPQTNKLKSIVGAGNGHQPCHTLTTYQVQILVADIDLFVLVQDTCPRSSLPSSIVLVQDTCPRSSLPSSIVLVQDMYPRSSLPSVLVHQVTQLLADGGRIHIILNGKLVVLTVPLLKSLCLNPSVHCLRKVKEATFDVQRVKINISIVLVSTGSLSVLRYPVVQSGKSSLTSWPDVKLIPQTNNRFPKCPQISGCPVWKELIDSLAGR